MAFGYDGILIRETGVIASVKDADSGQDALHLPPSEGALLGRIRCRSSAGHEIDTVHN